MYVHVPVPWMVWMMRLRSKGTTELPTHPENQQISTAKLKEIMLKGNESSFNQA